MRSVPRFVRELGRTPKALDAISNRACGRLFTTVGPPYKLRYLRQCRGLVDRGEVLIPCQGGEVWSRRRLGFSWSDLTSKLGTDRRFWERLTALVSGTRTNISTVGDASAIKRQISGVAGIGTQNAAFILQIKAVVEKEKKKKIPDVEFVMVEQAYSNFGGQLFELDP